MQVLDTMKNLPVDIQSIEKVLKDGRYVYVDKTAYAHQLITGGISNFFLSRPRRFGKSLFVDTLAEIFKGNKALFKDCAIYKTDYDWQPHWVLSFDFASIESTTAESLKTGIQEAIEDLARLYGVTVSGSSIQSQLKRFIWDLKKKGPIVVLVDEYDKPIMDNIEDPDVVEANRRVLSDFFGTFKTLNKHLAFVFVTGISRFSQVSISSGLNNLKNITMHPQYAAMMGYTEEELRSNFSAHIQAIAQERGSTAAAVLTEIKQWYNGYRFAKTEACVYNPFSTLNYLDEKDPKSYWYATSTPTFLIRELRKRPSLTPTLSNVSVSQTHLTDVRSIEDLDLPTLMFQTGYLTIKGWEYDATLEETVYSLKFPNKEVHKAFYSSLVKDLGRIPPQVISQHAIQLQTALTTLDVAAFVEVLNIQFAKVPYDAFRGANEGFYQTMLLLCLELSGLKTYGEVHTNLGRIDLVVQQPQHTFIFELKVDHPASVALDQIHTKRYQERYLKEDKEIVALAMSFSTETHNVSEWQGRLYTAEGELIQRLK